MNKHPLAALGLYICDRLVEGFEGRSVSAAALLLSLRSRGPLAITELALLLDISQPTATRLVDGLEREGLLRRLPRDGRVVQVKLTPAGQRKAERFQQARMAVIGELGASLSAKEQKLLSELTDKMLSGATKSRVQARILCRLCDHDGCVGLGCPIDRRAGQIEAG